MAERIEGSAAYHESSGLLVVSLNEVQDTIDNGNKLLGL